MLTRSGRSTAALLSPNNHVDVGVLGIAAGTNANMGEDEEQHLQNELEDNNDNAGSEEDIYITSDLYDVHVGLFVACHDNGAGSCCASGRADALPNILGLCIDGIGDQIPLPITDIQANAIKSKRISQVVQDKSYHKVYSVAPASIHIQNPAWKVVAPCSKLLQTVAYNLGVNPNTLTAEVKMLLYMEKGSRIDRHSNALLQQNNDTTVLGALFVQLPSAFTGGKFSIFAGGGEDEDGDEIEEITTNFDVGASSGDSTFSCYFLAHYSDCEIKCSKVLSGTRLLLVYSLHTTTTVQPVPTANHVISSMVSIRLWVQMMPIIFSLLPTLICLLYLLVNAEKVINGFASSRSLVTHTIGKGVHRIFSLKRS